MDQYGEISKSIMLVKKGKCRITHTALKQGEQSQTLLWVRVYVVKCEACRDMINSGM